jgi:signal transduction histidine kinase
MVVAVLGVAVLAWWDARREATAALDDFAREQESVADAVAAALRAKVSAIREEALDMANGEAASSNEDHLKVEVVAADAPPRLPAEAEHAIRIGFPFTGARRLDTFVPMSRLMDGVKPVERPGALLLLIRPPGERALMRTDGTVVRSAPVEAGLDARVPFTRLNRADAAALGLPERLAVAGMTSIQVQDAAWAVAAVASAQGLRDREARAQWRLVLSVLVAGSLVIAFGGLALRRQRRELELARELSIAQVEQELDERLVRADKLATMGALATGIAHEVSTPLGVISGRAEQLRAKTSADPKAKKSVESILEQVERINRTIRGFLGLARGAAPALEKIEPARLVERSVSLVEHRFAKAGVLLESDVEPGLPAIACEPRLFEQVLVNLLLNACDACRPGGRVELGVSAAGERMSFVVRDDGGGITRETAARALEPFFTTKPEGEGTGLGLAIANEIVKHHGGTLTLAPREEGGTIARVEVAVAKESANG